MCDALLQSSTSEQIIAALVVSVTNVIFDPGLSCCRVPGLTASLHQCPDKVIRQCMHEQDNLMMFTEISGLILYYEAHASAAHSSDAWYCNSDALAYAL